MKSQNLNKSQILKQALILFCLMIGTLTLFNLTAVATGLEAQPISSIDEKTGGETSLRGLVLTIVDYFLGFLGLLAVIMVVYGGVTYVSSAGNDEAVGKAKKIIMYALIGIIVILLSIVVVRAVLGAGTGTE